MGGGGDASMPPPAPAPVAERKPWEKPIAPSAPSQVNGAESPRSIRK